MIEDQIQNLINANYRSFTLLGMITAIIYESNVSDKHKQWISEAITNITYLDKPIPEMPK